MSNNSQQVQQVFNFKGLSSHISATTGRQEALPTLDRNTLGEHGSVVD
jgi:hypothetical protein